MRWSRTATLFFSSWNMSASSWFDSPSTKMQQEQAGVVAVQGGDGAPKPLLQQRRRLDGGVRRQIVIDRLRMKLPAAQDVDGRVDGRAPEIGGRQRYVLDVPTQGQDAQEDGLQDILGVRRIPGERRAARNTAS